MKHTLHISNKWNKNLLPNILLACLLFLFPLISNNINYGYAKEILALNICMIFIVHFLIFKTQISIYTYDIYIIIGLVYIISNTKNWNNDTYTIIYYIIAFFCISKTKWNINILYIIMSISTSHAFISISNNWTLPLMGIMKNSGITGIYLAITYPIGYSLLLKTQNHIYKTIYGLILSVIIVCLFLTDSRTAILSVSICSLYIYMQNKNVITNYIRKVSFKKLTIYILLLTSLCTIFLYYLINHRKGSVDGRILIYKITSKMISEKPLKGFGYNTFYSIYPDYQASYFTLNPNSKYKIFADNTKYGFNEILQIGAEYGIIGIILILSLMINLFTIKNKKNKFMVTSLKYSLLSIFIVSLSSYPFRRLETLLIITTLIGILASFDRRVLFSFDKIQSKLLIISLVFFYFNAINSTINRKKAYTIWQKTKNALISNKEKMTIYDSIRDILKHDTLFLYDYATILYNCQKNKESNIYLEKILKHMNTSYIWILKGNNYKNTNNFQEAIKCYTHASQMVPNRIFPLYQLMLLYKENDKNNKMLETAKLISKFNTKISSYTTQKIKEQANEIISNYNK